MSLHDKGEKRAVELFRDALKRLQDGEPINLPPGSPVTAANVAKEAGKSPSALRPDRYPELIQEIKSRKELERRVKKYETSGKRGRRRRLEVRLDDCEKQRDRLQSICHAQQELIDELHDTIQQLEQDKKPLAFPGCHGDDS